MYKKELRNLIITGIIGFAIGFIFTFCISPDFGFWGACTIGIFVAGLPYGWQLSSRIFGSWAIIGNVSVLLVSFVLRFAIAMMIGWIAYPIALIYYIVRSKQLPIA